MNIHSRIPATLACAMLLLLGLVGLIQAVMVPHAWIADGLLSLVSNALALLGTLGAAVVTLHALYGDTYTHHALWRVLAGNLCTLLLSLGSFYQGIWLVGVWISVPAYHRPEALAVVTLAQIFLFSVTFSAAWLNIVTFLTRRRAALAEADAHAVVQLSGESTH